MFRPGGSSDLKGVGVGKYIIRRLLQMIPVIIGVTFIIYVAVFALGDPTVGRCGERPCPEGYIAKFRADYNLDKPLVVQYLLWAMVQGDLGELLRQRGDRRTGGAGRPRSSSASWRCSSRP